MCPGQSVHYVCTSYGSGILPRVIWKFENPIECHTNATNFVTVTVNNVTAKERTIQLCENNFTVSFNALVINETFHTSRLNISLLHHPLEFSLTCDNSDIRHLKVAGIYINQ